MITLWNERPKPNFIEWAIRLDTPYMTCDEANAEVIRLKVDNMKLQAALDAEKMRGNYGR